VDHWIFFTYTSGVGGETPHREEDRMPAMGWYEVKISGVLRGPIASNKKQIDEFQDVFPVTKPPSASNWTPLLGWPKGFMLPGYKEGFWISDADDVPSAASARALGGDTVTLLTFHVELLKTFPGTLFINRVKMIEDVKWFYEYCDREWYKELKRKINDLNASFQLAGKLIGRVDFHAWKWYCGNGGGD
jgi:hypothetical protein